MTPLNEDADDASSVGTDGSNVAPGLVFDDEEDFFAHKGDEIRLNELVGRTGKPVIFFGDHHGKSANQPALKANLSDPENFRGMEDKLVLSAGARVLLTDNIWIEAGLMNGAIGTLKGSMSFGGRHCVIVEFDNEVFEDDNSFSRSILLGGADKALCVPVFYKSVNSLNREGMYGAQFPLVLVSAPFRWQAQGTTF